METINFFYPKASLALNLHSFDFWGEDKIVNRFKPRVAYGEAGTFAAFGSVILFMEIHSIDGNVGIVVPGIREMLKLALETSELEFGLMQAFKDRVIRIYLLKKTRKDLLLNAAIEPSRIF
jgi:hypothetical protein